MTVGGVAQADAPPGLDHHWPAQGWLCQTDFGLMEFELQHAGGRAGWLTGGIHGRTHQGLAVSIDTVGTFIPADGSDPIDFTETVYGHGLSRQDTVACTLTEQFDVGDGVVIVSNTLYIALLN